MVIPAQEESKFQFSDIIQLHDLYYSTIIECTTKECSVFTKYVSKNEIVVYGDYKVIVLYKKLYADGENNYGSLTVSKNICELVSLKATKNIEMDAQLVMRPACIFKFEKYDRGNSFWEISIQGELHIINFPNSEIKNLENPPAENSPPKDAGFQSPDHVWQFEQNDDISIEQMLDMDLESLKKMKK